MDFTKWISSLDELLYELVSWLVFFPLTLWRIVAHPLSMMAYAEDQLALPVAEQYAESIKPPLFLILALLIAHAVSLALGDIDEIVAKQDGLASLVQDQTTALVLRIVMFASFALFTAARMTRKRKQRLSRSSLRGPFYSQCYPTAVLALGLGLGADLIETKGLAATLAGLVFFAVFTLHYSSVQTKWFAHNLGISRIRGAGLTMFGLLEASGVVLLVAFLFAS